MTMRIDSRMFGFIPPMIRNGLKSLPPVKRITGAVLNDFGIPKSALEFLNYPTRFDSRETERVLKGTGIEVPRLSDYAPAIWDFWERKLDPDLYKIIRYKAPFKVKFVSSLVQLLVLAWPQHINLLKLALLFVSLHVPKKHLIK